MNTGIDRDVQDAKQAVMRNNLHDAQKEVMTALESTIRACSYFDPTSTSEPIVLFLYRAASQLRAAADKIEERVK